MINSIKKIALLTIFFGAVDYSKGGNCSSSNKKPDTTINKVKENLREIKFNMQYGEASNATEGAEVKKILKTAKKYISDLNIGIFTDPNTIIYAMLRMGILEGKVNSIFTSIEEAKKILYLQNKHKDSYKLLLDAILKINTDNLVNQGLGNIADKEFFNAIEKDLYEAITKIAEMQEMQEIFDGASSLQDYSKWKYDANKVEYPIMVNGDKGLEYLVKMQKLDSKDCIEDPMKYITDMQDEYIVITSTNYSDENLSNLKKINDHNNYVISDILPAISNLYEFKNDLSNTELFKRIIFAVLQEAKRDLENI